VDDPVIKYVPEIAGRGLDVLTIRNLLRMDSGIRYRSENEILAPFSDDALTYYSPDLRRVAFGVQPGQDADRRGVLLQQFPPAARRADPRTRYRHARG
jgi:CubicO group peptidase (beta-lactamase class C family)